VHVQVVNGKNQGYGLPADIWSLGCTVLEMLTSQIPYSGLEGVRVMLFFFFFSLMFIVMVMLMPFIDCKA
jgi:serine/threonine protein kinase